MKHVSFDECDTTEEVCTVFNRLIDNQNLIEAKVEQLASVKKAKKKTKKKGAISMKTLVSIVAVLLILFAVTLCPAPVTLTEINHDNVTSGTFDQSLRGWMDTLNKDIVLAGGGSGLRSGGTVYYVDGNKSTAGNGLSWEGAFNTLSAAMAASHANIAVSSRRAWASRNTIFVRADEIVEDLTTMAQKTDIIGVGSNDGYKKAGITGTWIIPDTVSYMGCRFYNMMFTDTGANAIFDIDTQGGLEFHYCLFDSSTSTTIGLQVEETSWLVVNSCEFSRVSASMGFSASAIKVVDDTNPIYGCRITNNSIMGNIGIDWDETQSYNCWIEDNYMSTTGIGIDEEGDNVHVIGNRMITAVDTGTYTNGFDFSEAKAIDNTVTGSGGETDITPLPETTAN